MNRPLLWLMLIAGFASCKKEEMRCSGNCVDVTVSGRAYDATSNKGFAHIPVTIHWYASYTMGGLSNSPKLVYKGKTAIDGKFSFVISVDPSLFERFHLGIRVPIQTGYIRRVYDHLEETMSDYEPLGFQQIDFAMYPKTNLTIRLHRVQNDSFMYFSVGHFYKSNERYSDYSNSGSQFARDTIIQTETSANIYTRVISSKTFGFGSFVQQVDSILARMDGNNIIDINY